MIVNDDYTHVEEEFADENIRVCYIDININNCTFCFNEHFMG